MSQTRSAQDIHVDKTRIGFLGAAVGAIVAVMMRDRETRQKIVNTVLELKREAKAVWEQTRKARNEFPEISQRKPLSAEETKTKPKTKN